MSTLFSSFIWLFNAWIWIAWVVHVIKLRMLLHLYVSQINGKIERAIYGSSHKDIKGKTCCLESYFSWLADSWASQLLLREDTFLPHEPKRVFPGCHGDYTSVYLTKPFAPLSASPPTGFSRSSPSAQRNFNYQQHFFNHRKAYYGQMRRYGKPGTASPPL